MIIKKQSDIKNDIWNKFKESQEWTCIYRNRNEQYE